MSDTSHLKCPRCGKELSPTAPEGLCPACLGALNFATETNVTRADVKEALPPLTPAELAPHFPQLEILECLGRGGMGVVYKARQKSLNRLVALKLLAPERVQDTKFAERFSREAHALAALNHPSIVTVHDFGQAGGFYFLLMEFVDGVNLRQLLRSHKLQPAEALAIVPPVCEALQYAHEHGIVHRDIKPENLLLAKDGRVKIADFGIAKILGNTPQSSEGGAVVDPVTPTDGATQQTTMGTPQYMAPEQREQPQIADHRADIYSLGVVLYELLTGELPTDKLPRPSSVRGVQIDVRLDEIVLRALEKTPELRYQTAGEFKTQVEGVTASVSPATSKSSALIKQTRGRYTSPEYLATPVGGFLKHEGKGELSLYTDHLIFAAAGKRTRIPFDSLRQLAAARGPRWSSPAGHQYLSLIYDEGGQKRHLLFMAGEGLFQIAADTEDVAADWIAAIQAAVVETGSKPVPVPEGGSVVFGASPWLAALVLIPMLLLAMLPWLFQLSRVLNPDPNHASDPGRWLGLFPLVAMLMGGFVTAVIVSRRSQHSRGSSKSVSFHAATVTFYAGIILGTLLIELLPFQFSRDSAYLLLVALMALAASVFGLLLGSAWREAEQRQDQDRLVQLKGRLKVLAIVAWVMAVPMVGFAVFLFLAMLFESGGWNPATSEVVLLPLTWLGAGLLPWAAQRLWRVSKEQATDSPSGRTGGGNMFLWAVVAVVAVLLLAGFALLSVNARRVAQAQMAAREAREAADLKVEESRRWATSTHSLEGPPFIANLPYGGSIELLAVRLQTGNTNQPWWRPDGSPSPYGPDITMERETAGAGGVLGLAKIKWPQPPAGKEASGVTLNGGGFALKNGLRVPIEEYSVIHFETVVASGDEAKLYVAVGVRDWETLLVMKPGAVDSLAGGAARRQWEFSATPSGNLQLAVKKLMQQPGNEYRLVAVDKAGKLHTPNTFHTTSTPGRPGGEYEALFDGISGFKEALKPEQVKEVYWQQRRLDSIEFARVSLKPGHLSKVAIRDFAGKGPVTTVAAKPQGVATKSIVFLTVTNHSGAINLMSSTPHLPGEVIQPVIRFEDGSVEAGSFISFGMKRAGGPDADSIVLTWQPFPALAPELELAAVAQIQERWASNNLVLTPGQATRVFTLTNAEGMKIYGEVNFKRVTHREEGASLSFRKATGFPGFVTAVFLSSTVPEGCKLVGRGQFPKGLTGEIHTNLSRTRHGPDGGITWFLRPVGKSASDRTADPKEVSELTEEAARQMNQLMSRGPLEVRLGQSIQAFSVTNSAGEVFSGSFELVGNKP